MQKDLTPESIVATLAGQGVAIETKSAQTYAAAISTILKGAAPAFAKVAFEEEPAGFIVEQRRNAP
jgi:hypothetical protein